LLSRPQKYLRLGGSQGDPARTYAENFNLAWSMRSEVAVAQLWHYSLAGDHCARARKPETMVSDAVESSSRVILRLHPSLTFRARI